VEFDLNLQKKPMLTIAKRLSRETTNDLGDTLNVSVGSMMIMEFKKFFYLCALDLLPKAIQLRDNLKEN
jgi:hypothetical protein